MGVRLLLDDEPGDNGATVFGTFGPDFELLDGISIRYYFQLSLSPGCGRRVGNPRLYTSITVRQPPGKCRRKAKKR
jgi:hypothetical protein